MSPEKPTPENPASPNPASPNPAPALGPDRQSIEAAIKRVQAGELSPAEATEWLLAGKAASIDSTIQQSGDHSIQQAANADELLSQLVDRLGTPPQDVINVWCEQVRSFTLTALMSGEEAPPIDLDQWQVRHDGGLQRTGNTTIAQHFDSVPTETSVAAAAQVEAFRIRLAGSDRRGDVANQAEAASSENGSGENTDAIDPSMSTGSTPSVVVVDGLAGDPPNDEVGQDKDNGSATSSKAKRETPSPARRILIPAALAVSVGAIGWILYSSSRDNYDPIAESIEVRPIEEGVSHNTDADSPNTSPVGGTSPVDGTSTEDSSLTSAELETFESTAATDDANTIDMSSELLSLDVVMPSMPMLTTGANQQLPHRDGGQPDGATEDGSKSNVSATSDDPTSTEAAVMMAGSGGDDPLAGEGDEDQPDESPQIIREAKTTAISLPPIDDIETVVAIADTELAMPRITFPFDVAIDLVASQSSDNDAGSTWTLNDRQKKVSVARIFTSGGSTKFQWNTSAKRSSAANLISHGGLQGSSGQLVYMRPKIESEPYRIPMNQPDLRPSWDIASPLPPRVARISLDFNLPAGTKDRKGIEVGWIEPIDSTSPRRTRALAVLAPTDGETVAVGLRFDIRCSRKLSSRIRLFGRIDPSTPWQQISTPILQRMADQVTAQATRLSQMSTRMSTIYSNASSSGRRALRPQRDAIEAQSNRIVEISTRLAELQSLVNQIESEVQVRFRLWVQWGEDQQELLVMTESE